MSPNPTGPPLTRAQAEVLPLLAEGLTVIEIGAQLYMSPHTVKAHLNDIRRRWTARNAAQVVALAYQYGHLCVKETIDAG